MSACDLFGQKNSKAILARSAADRPGDTSPAVHSFVRQWRTREDEEENWVIVLSTPR
jgi:hypothetical protein